MARATLVVSIVCDIPDSFMHELIPDLANQLREKGHRVSVVTDLQTLGSGDIAFFISCRTILTDKELARHTTNLVVHPSRLPDGKGSGVVSWKILEGESELWVSLFYPDSSLDGGPIAYQGSFVVEGHELCDEIRRRQAATSFELIHRFVDDYPDNPRIVQQGKGSFYKKRLPHHSQLDPHRTVAEQFDLLRVSDNQRYPAFFEYRGHTYRLRIDKVES